MHHGVNAFINKKLRRNEFFCFKNCSGEKLRSFLTKKTTFIKPECNTMAGCCKVCSAIIMITANFTNENASAILVACFKQMPAVTETLGKEKIKSFARMQLYYCFQLFFLNDPTLLQDPASEC
jgi:hypothetical protein